MTHAERSPITPTADLVRAAVQRFDDENPVVETALRDLFRQYPLNNNEAHVLLKVVALNRLYSTNIYAVHAMAHHIFQQAGEIDSALATGSPVVVDKIASITIRATGKKRTNYSFASKYCSWHRPDKYPIWDSRVRAYLQSLRRSLRNTDDVGLLGANQHFWNVYPEFVELVSKFQKRYKVDDFTFKDIDKFLWLYGNKLIGKATAATEV
jgi:hypothetical protein